MEQENKTQVKAVADGKAASGVRSVDRDIDWGAFMSALYDIRYEGPVCIEIEDKAFESCPEDVLKSIAVSVKHISQFYQK